MSTRVTSAPAAPANVRSRSAARVSCAPCGGIVARSVATSNRTEKRRDRLSADPACLKLATNKRLRSMNDHALRAAPDRVRLPVLVEDRPQRLIEILAVLEKRLAQQPSCTAPIFPSAPLPRPLRTAARASSRCTPTVSNANSTTSSAPSWNTPVPQNAEPIANPHSAVPKPGSSCAHLEDADRGVVAVERDREAGIRAGRALAQRPGDELLEAFDRCSAAAR